MFAWKHNPLIKFDIYVHTKLMLKSMLFSLNVFIKHCEFTTYLPHPMPHMRTTAFFVQGFQRTYFDKQIYYTEYTLV